MNAETAVNKKVTKTTGEKRMLVKNVGGGGLQRIQRRGRVYCSLANLDNFFLSILAI